MVLSNDKKRREYVSDVDNWEIVGDILGLVQLRKLTYDRQEWLAICVRRTWDTYNVGKHGFDRVTKWVITGMYQIDKEFRTLDNGWSQSQIVEVIKNLRKEEKKK